MSAHVVGPRAVGECRDVATSTGDRSVREHGLLIGGELAVAAETFDRCDPAHPQRLTGRFGAAAGTDVARAYAAAAEAADGWARTSAVQRGEVLRRAADLLEGRTEEAARRLTADMGKAIRDARAEAGRAVSILRYHAADALQPSGATYPSAEPDTLLMTISEPVGVVCAITPWNFPLAIPAWKLAPALACGNAVVWKPAAAASGSALLLAEVLAEAELPPGVLNVVTGSGAALSESLTSDPSLAALTFTGSVEVGNGVQSAAVARGAKVQLELGGKNPAVVLADADLERAAESVAAGAMLATGQRCTATSRVYVQSAAYERFVSLLVERVEALRVGDPYDESTDVGPLAFAERLQAVRAYLEMAHEGGAAILAGGTAGDPADGYYVAPTVLAEVPTDSPLVREEIFGPVVVVAPVPDLDAGIEAANDTPFGLSASLFSSDLDSALTFARRIASGQVHINRETAGAEPHVPFGGMKGSSNLQREQGKAARRFFTNSKTVYVRPR